MNNSPNRVAIFLPALYGGGAERSMLKLAGGIAERDYTVDLVLARAQGPYLAEIPSKINVIDLKATRDMFSLLPLANYLRMARPAVLLTGLHTNLIAVWARELAGVPTRLVVSERTTLSQKVENYASDLRMRLMPQMVRRFYPWADYIVAVSKGVADDLIRQLRIPSEMIHVIYNPIITPDLRIKMGSPLNHPWFGPGQPPVILSAGRLCMEKDFTTLISAFARIRETNDARLLILGEGDARRSLEAQVRNLGLEEHICLPGFVSNPYPYMREASVFVLSSKYEGLPGVLIEALFCGPQLVATDCPSGPREILCGGDYGQLVPVGDPASLAQAIRKALSSDVAPSPEASWKRFELEAVVDQYLDLFFGDGSRSTLESKSSEREVCHPGRNIDAVTAS